MWNTLRETASLTRKGLENTLAMYEIGDLLEGFVEREYMALFNKNSIELKRMANIPEDSTDDIRDYLCEDALKMIINHENQINNLILEQKLNEADYKLFLIGEATKSPFNPNTIYTIREYPIERSPIKR